MGHEMAKEVSEGARHVHTAHPSDMRSKMLASNTNSFLQHNSVGMS